MTKYNQHKETYELSDYEQFQVKLVGTNVDDSGNDYELDHGYWNVTEIDVRDTEPKHLLFVLHNNHGMTQTVTADELRITPEAGHRKHCIAQAMISYIENWRDAEDINAFDFVTNMQVNILGDGTILAGPYEAALEALSDGTSTCICLTSKGLI